MEFNADKVDGDKVFELEDVSATEEVPTPVVTLDLVNRQKFFDFPNPKESLSRTSIKSTCAEQMLLLGKTDTRRLMPNPENKNIFCTRECKYLGYLLKCS